MQHADGRQAADLRRKSRLLTGGTGLCGSSASAAVRTFWWLLNVGLAQSGKWLLTLAAPPTRHRLFKFLRPAYGCKPDYDLLWQVAMLMRTLGLDLLGICPRVIYCHGTTP